MSSNFNVPAPGSRLPALELTGRFATPLSLADLRVFLAVAARGSFSRAADQLGRSQPAVSLAVRRLEDELGQPLITRSANPLQLSAAGRVVEEYGRRMLELCGETRTALHRLREAASFRINIATAETIVDCALPLVAGFQRQFPDSHVKISYGASLDIAARVSGGILDFGIVAQHSPHSSLESVALGTDRLVALAHPSHRLAARSSVSIRELQHEMLIVHTDCTTRRNQVTFEGGAAARAFAVIGMPGVDAIKRLVELDAGIACLPSACARFEIAQRTIASVPVADADPIRVTLIHRRERHLSEGARAFLQLALALDRKSVSAESGSRHRRHTASAMTG